MRGRLGGRDSRRGALLAAVLVLVQVVAMTVVGPTPAAAAARPDQAAGGHHGPGHAHGHGHGPGAWTPSSRSSGAPLRPRTLRGTYRLLESSTSGAGPDHVQREVLETPEGWVDVKLPPGHGLKPNQEAELSGATDGTTMDVAEATAVAAAEANPPATGTTKVLVILATWTTPDSVTPAIANDVIFTQGNAWFGEASYGKLQLTGAVTPWVSIAGPTGGDCYGYSDQVMSRAKTAAAAAGFNAAEYNRTIVYFPRCAASAAGWAYVGGSSVWINGFMDQRVTIHEEGHNYGLLHANLTTCTVGGQLVTFANSGCSSFEYGDDFDAMGGSNLVGHFSGPHKQLLGWLDAGGRKTMAANDSATLSPLETAGGLEVAEVRASSARAYWLELRTAAGLDSDFRPGALGVQLRVTDAAVGQGTPHLLDALPLDEASVVLPPQSSWTTPEGARISVGEVTATSAQISVAGGAGPPQVPGTPAAISAVAGDETATVGWARPSDNGAVINSFVVTQSPGGQTATFPGTATSGVVTGLANGTAYTFTVRAVNAVGTGPPSASSAPVTPTLAVPSVSITSPATGTLVNADQVAVTVNAAPNPVTNFPIQWVELLIDDEVVDVDFAAPYSFTADLSWYDEGQHRIGAVARDTNTRELSDEVTIDLVLPKPQVTITSPTSGATLQGLTTQVVIDAQSPTGDISYVELDLGQHAVYYAEPDQGVPGRWTVALDTAYLEDGPVTLTATAYDAFSRKGTSPPVTVTIQRPAPSAVIVSPTSGTVSGLVEFAATASPHPASGAAVNTVLLEVDGITVVGYGVPPASAGAPWTFSVDLRYLPNGLRSFVAIAYDDLGFTGRSAPVTLTLANPTPTVVVNQPGSGATVGGDVTFRATPTPNPSSSSPIGSVSFELDGITVAYATDNGDGTWVAQWDSRYEDNGPRLLTATAYDNDGYQGVSAGRTIQLSNPGPTVALTSPATGAVVTGNVPVTASAATNPATGSPITYVEFQLDGWAVDYRDAPPYSIEIPEYYFEPGPHTLRARVYDAAGLVRSSPVTAITWAVLPDAPGTPAGAPGDASVDLTWSAPTSNGGAAISDYVVQRSTDGMNWAPVADGASPLAAATITGLTNGTGYRFRVAAVNPLGQGEFSPASAVVTPRTVPSAPAAPAASPGDAQAFVSWTAPATGGAAITDYAIQRSTDNGGTWTSVTDGTSTATSASVTGLTNGTAYRFRVAALNSVGQGAFSPASAPVTPVPGLGSVVTVTRVSTEQYTLPNSNGATWVPIDAADLAMTVNPTTAGTAVITANADLWTWTAGLNQDIGIFVDNTLVAWKESGGFAGTFSPNAAYVEAVVPLTAGSHTIDLRWKSNKNAPGQISAGAGPINTAFSPTRLTALLIPS